MQIKATETVVNTVQVEIKALMVGKKQFTIAMFKQLEESSPFIHLDPETGGGRWKLCNEATLWGLIRYPLRSELAPKVKVPLGRPLGSSSLATQEWILWESEGELFRCPINNGFVPSGFYGERMKISYIELNLQHLFIAV